MDSSSVSRNHLKMAMNAPPITPVRKKSMNGALTPSNGKKPRVSPAGQSYAVGARVEAKDFSGHWFPATVSEVDWEEREILIHFDKYEEWMPMDSQRVRPFKEIDAASPYPSNQNLGRITGMNGHYFPESKPVDRRFKVGEHVMATWSNNRKYPATIANQQPNDRYDVIFYDGFPKSVRGSKISKMKESDIGLKHQMKSFYYQVPSSNVGNHLQLPQHFPPHLRQQANQPNQHKSQVSNGSVPSSNPLNHQLKPVPGQSQLEKQLLQPPNSSLHPNSSMYSSYNNSINGFLPAVENIGTKEQRRERKRKHNVKELFSTKRPRGSEKQSSKVRSDKKSPSVGIVSSMTPLLSSSLSSSNLVKSVGVPSSVTALNVSDNPTLDNVDSELKKKRKKFKKKLDGFGSDSQESTSSVKQLKSPSSEDDDCNIQWTNGEPQGEAAYVIESAEGPRKSIIVDDRRLPVGWSKHAIRRQGGTSAGKWDVFLVSPRDGRKFRSRNELRSYHDERGLQFQVERFDFSLGRKKMYRQKAAAAARAAAHEDRPDSSSPVPSNDSPEMSGASLSSSGSNSYSTPQPTGLHPPAPHSITPQVTSLGVQRVKTLLPRRTSSNVSPNRRIMSPPPPHLVAPQPILPVSSSIESLHKKSLSAGSDGCVCPKDGCGKRFRKENLLQMHIKHYHPEYNAFMGSTPNVADLAYARTVGEPVAEMPNRCRPGQGSSFMEKIEKISRMEAHRKAGTETSAIGSEPTSSLEARSPTLGQLLKKGPMRKDSLDGTTAAAQAAAAWMVETASDSASNMSPMRDPFKATMSPSPNVDRFREKGDSISRPVSRSAGLASDCDQDSFMEQNGHGSPWKGGTLDGMPVSTSSSPVTVQQSSPYFYSKKKKHRAPVEKLNVDQIKQEEGKPQSPPTEHLRREELINCTCGYTEEDGLMIQCDLCLCWQHGLCNQIENIEDVPQKYVCQICQNPVRERRSRHFIHDQDWLKEGVLPSLSFTAKESVRVQQREDILKRSHDLCALLLMTQKVIHSLRVKVHIAEQKDHPKLYLWATSWQTESMGCPTPPSSPALAVDQKPDKFGVVGKGKSLLQEALLNGSPHQQQQHHLQLHQPVDAPRIPQPEAPIDPGECRIKLLDHIEHYQSLIDARLSTLEQMIDELEREDPTLIDGKMSDAVMTAVQARKGGDSDDTDTGEEETSLDFFPQTKETVQMILRDLSNLKKISTLC